MSKVDTTKAEQLGADTFKAGLLCVALRDRKLIKMLDGIKNTEDRGSLIHAWKRGYMAAKVDKEFMGAGK